MEVLDGLGFEPDWKERVEPERDDDSRGDTTVLGFSVLLLGECVRRAVRPVLFAFGTFDELGLSFFAFAFFDLFIFATVSFESVEFVEFSGGFAVWRRVRRSTGLRSWSHQVRIQEVLR